MTLALRLPLFNESRGIEPSRRAGIRERAGIAAMEASEGGLSPFSVQAGTDYSGRGGSRLNAIHPGYATGLTGDTKTFALIFALHSCYNLIHSRVRMQICGDVSRTGFDLPGRP